MSESVRSASGELSAAAVAELDFFRLAGSGFVADWAGRAAAQCQTRVAISYQLSATDFRLRGTVAAYPVSAIACARRR
jgi:hypothetical protein